MKDDVNHWFSIALDRKVIVIRSPENRLRENDPDRMITGFSTDRRKTFVSDAALHIVNLNSLRDLR
jgi:hypothetical protein